MLKKILYLACGIVLMPVLAASFQSCSHKSKYLTEETPLGLKLVERGAAYLTVGVEPQDDRVYYMFHLLEKAEYDSLAPYEKDVKDYIISLLMEDYNEFRNLVDPDNEERYFCSFADFSLNYAYGQRNFTSLRPGEKYVAIAFCVNPETNQPMGALYHAEFSTMALGDVKESTMDFGFRVWDDDDEDTKETRLYYKPLEKNVISKDYYIVGDAVEVDTLNLVYGGDLAAYVMEYEDAYSSYELMDVIIKKDIYEYAYHYGYEGLEDFGLKEGKEYVIWAMPYSLDRYDKIRYHRFTYERGYKENEYSHGTLWDGKLK